MEAMTMKHVTTDLIRKHLNRKLIGFLMILVMFIYILSLIPSKIAYADESHTRTKLYKSIQIKDGDTLWGIASDHYSKEWDSLTQYIELIKNCNSLYDDKITAGCYLIIPYYMNDQIITQ